MHSRQFQVDLRTGLAYIFLQQQLRKGTNCQMSLSHWPSEDKVVQGRVCSRISNLCVDEHIDPLLPEIIQVLWITQNRV